MLSKNLIKLMSCLPYKSMSNTVPIVGNNWKIMYIQSVGNSSKAMKNFSYELPPLMSFKPSETQFPNMVPFDIQFYFKTFVDKSFQKQRFIEFVKQNVIDISGSLAKGDIEAIRNSLTKEAFEEVSKNFKNFTSEQKSKLKVTINDITQCFPHGIRVERIGKEFDVKIDMVIDATTNFADPEKQNIISLIKSPEFVEDHEPNEFNMKLLDPLLMKKSVCYYQFHRIYPSDESRIPRWLVSKLIHFKHKDVWKLHGLID